MNFFVILMRFGMEFAYTQLRMILVKHKYWIDNDIFRGRVERLYPRNFFYALWFTFCGKAAPDFKDF